MTTIEDIANALRKGSRELMNVTRKFPDVDQILHHEKSVRSSVLTEFQERYSKLSRATNRNKELETKVEIMKQKVETCKQEIQVIEEELKNDTLIMKDMNEDYNKFVNMLRELEEHRAAREKLNNDTIPKIIAEYSLLKYITNIRWHFDETKQNLLMGYVRIRDDLIPFCLDKTQHSEVYIADFLWNVVTNNCSDNSFSDILEPCPAASGDCKGQTNGI